ncbi:MAG TPA: VanZ family protein [Gemmataceae bacterium]|nr:VanZ family protein [Gemmataceae bacterium]
MTGGRPVPAARHFAILTAAFTAFVIYGSLVPFHTRHVDLADAWDQYARAMFRVPRLASRSDWVANVLLFVPLGYLAAGAVAVDRRRRLAVVALVPLMTGLSAGLEFAQIWFPERYTSLNDVIGETVGGAIGVAAWLVAGQWVTDWARGLWANVGPGDWGARVLPVYLVFVVIAHGMPFDLTLSPWQIHRKYQRGREPDAERNGVPRIAAAPSPTRAGEKTLLNMSYFVPVGCLLARFPGRWRRQEATGRVLLAGLVLAAGVESMQVIVLSHEAYATDALSAGLFVLGGWLLSIRRATMRPWTWAVAAIAWIVALAAALWMPFDGEFQRFVDRIEHGDWVPFVDFAAGDYLTAFNRIVSRLVLFAPLGFLLVRAGMTGRVATAVGGIVSGTIEVGQAALTTHRPSASDLILGAIGAGLGGIIAIRVAAADRAAAGE